MSKYTWLLDAGHGGLINGIYQTPGKRSPEWELGVYYEGVGNRDFVQRILQKAKHHNLTVIDPYPTDKDIPLKKRTNIINKLHKENNNVIVISIHSNAGGGSGFEIFTSPGNSPSDKVATVFYEEISKKFPKVKMRPDWSDGDPDKEANFWILTKTYCPAILTENLFMDNKIDYQMLFNNEARDKIAQAHLNAIIRFEREF